MVVLDTDFVIDLMRRHEGAVVFLKSLLESPDPAGISAVTVMQLYHGVARFGLPEEEEARVDRSLKGLAVYELTRAIAERAGRLDGELALAGQQIDLADVIVGATALDQNVPLVTRNKRHFGRLKGLRLVEY